MKKILTLLLINLIYINAGTIEPKKVKAKDKRANRGGHHNSLKGVKEDILFSSSEATAHISTELSFALSIEATSYSTTQERRVRRHSYIDSNRESINLNMAQAGGEHLSALLKLLEIKEEKIVLKSIQKRFTQLSRLDNKELSEALLKI